MRLRTIRQVHQELRAADPGCCLTYHNVLTMVETGEWPSISHGKRRYVDLDWVMEYLHQQTSKDVKNGGRK